MGEERENLNKIIINILPFFPYNAKFRIAL